MYKVKFNTKQENNYFFYAKIFNTHDPCIVFF